VVDTAFKYKHYSEIDTFGGVEFPMLIEVGLLSRNILIKGADEDSIGTNYGAHMMMMGHENEGL